MAILLFEFGRGEIDEAVAAAGIETVDARDRLDAASEPASRNEDEKIDRFGDEAARHGDDGFLDQLLEPVERRRGAIRVDGRDAAWMAGVPCLEHVERLAAANLADDDAIGPEPQRRANEVGHGDRPRALGTERPRSQRHDVARRALK